MLFKGGLLYHNLLNVVTLISIWHGTCDILVKTRRNYEPLFLILDGFHFDGEQCYWENAE